MLSIQNYSKTYDGKKYVVEDLSFEVNNGDIFGFIGHNGAGKTTTIKSCVGILDFESGDILIDGKSIKTDSLTCKKEIAYLPDNPDLYDFMTGTKYLNFIADIYGISSDKRAELIKKYADAFEFTSSLSAPIDTYSHGMKQKLAIIGALIHSPRLLICDEPFVGLDPKSSLAFKNIMHEMCDNGGAVLFSTHVLEVAEKLCNRIAIIMHGKLVACGNIDEVKGTESLEDVFMELVNE